MKNYQKVIGARVDKTTYELLKKVAGQRGEDISDFVRRSMLKELAELGSITDADVLMALGVDKKEEEKE